MEHGANTRRGNICPKLSTPYEQGTPPIRRLASRHEELIAWGTYPVEAAAAWREDPRREPTPTDRDGHSPYGRIARLMTPSRLPVQARRRRGDPGRQRGGGP
ncbi:hypothetical protein GCM10018777_11470 [Streptomyces albogriseolus]|nr:hypothetical protein GCM10018777_11470 [Streptomyces viridodiastaticus]